METVRAQTETPNANIQAPANIQLLNFGIEIERFTGAWRLEFGDSPK
jgi:hypothetical protein